MALPTGCFPFRKAWPWRRQVQHPEATGPEDAVHTIHGAEPDPGGVGLAFDRRHLAVAGEPGPSGLAEGIPLGGLEGPGGDFLGRIDIEVLPDPTRRGKRRIGVQIELPEPVFAAEGGERLTARLGMDPLEGRGVRLGRTPGECLGHRIGGVYVHPFQAPQGLTEHSILQLPGGLETRAKLQHLAEARPERELTNEGGGGSAGHSPTLRFIFARARRGLKGRKREGSASLT